VHPSLRETRKKDGQGWRLSNQTRDELDTVANRNGPVSLYAKETAIVNNLYGVDIDDGAVEICKLRLWLSMVADIEDDPGDVQALPNIDFNIRQGNSLIGFTELMEVNDNGDASLASFGGESVKVLSKNTTRYLKQSTTTVKLHLRLKPRDAGILPNPDCLSIKTISTKSLR